MSAARRPGLAAACALLAPLAAAADGPFADGAAALAALEQRLGAPVRLMRVAIYPDAVELEAQDPKQPMHVDRYRWERGALSDGEPLQVGRDRREIKARLFELPGPVLARVPSLLPGALAAVAAEGGNVSHVEIERYSGWGESNAYGSPVIQVVVHGPRAGGSVEYATDGKRRRVTKW